MTRDPPAGTCGVQLNSGHDGPFFVQAGPTSHAAWVCCRSRRRSKSVRVWCSREVWPRGGLQLAAERSLTEETAIMARRRLQMAHVPQPPARCSSCSAPSSRSRPVAATTAPSPQERPAQPVGSTSCLPRGGRGKGPLRRRRHRGPSPAVSAPPSGAAAFPVRHGLQAVRAWHWRALRQQHCQPGSR